MAFEYIEILKTSKCIQFTHVQFQVKVFATYSTAIMEDDLVEDQTREASLCVDHSTNHHIAKYWLRLNLIGSGSLGVDGFIFLCKAAVFWAVDWIQVISESRLKLFAS